MYLILRQQLRTLLLLLSLAALALPNSAIALDINTASAAELTTLKGIGEKRASAIIRFRAKHGPFKSADDLLNVPGIGPRILSDNAQQLELDHTASQ